MTLAEASYEIASADGQKALEALERRFRVASERCSPRRLIYYDSFDWRIYNAGGTLTARPDKNGVVLRWDGGASAARRRGRRLAAMPGFVWDLPPGKLRSDLTKVLKMRRLLPMVEVRRRCRSLRILNRDEKTVARVRLEQRSAGSPGARSTAESLPAALLRVLPVRGYRAAYRRLVSWIEGDLGLEPPRASELDSALAAIGRTPADYSSKLRLDLDPAATAEEATRTIFRALLATIEANEDGLRRDLDSEFLHDFRVAVRRTRSALTQIKGVLPPAVSERYKGEFAWLGGETGPLRDLDVYLLKIPGYRAALPAAVRQDLAPLASFLAACQRAEHRRLVAVLAGERYRELIRGWGETLARPFEDAGRPNAHRPILEVSSERIWKVYRRALKEGRAIGDETPAEALHRLRIRCKKLRYLLEFFRCLYDSETIAPLIARLKKLQDNLGDFNDYEVQQGSIAEFARRMQEQNEAPAATLMAMGRLVEHLERGQERERRRFAECFAGFDAEDNRERFRRLFEPLS